MNEILIIILTHARASPFGGVQNMTENSNFGLRNVKKPVCIAVNGILCYYSRVQFPPLTGFP